MEKLLHERLRDLASGEAFVQDFARMMDVELACKTLGMAFRESVIKTADEIERYYIPRPRFEDGEPVQGFDKDERVNYYYVYDDGSWVVRFIKEDGSDYDEINGKAGEPVKFPTPKVLDADGVPCNLGEAIYSILTGAKYEIIKLGSNIQGDCHDITVRDGNGMEYRANGHLYVHEKPVFDAEGVRIKNGDEVWELDGLYDVPLTVLDVNFSEKSVKVSIPDGKGYTAYAPELLSHEKPVFDAYGERICKGDTVWGTLLGDKHEVSLVKNGCVYLDDGSICFEPSQLTHREPDSLQRVRDYARKLADDGAYNEDELNEIADRLTALMERGN